MSVLTRCSQMTCRSGYVNEGLYKRICDLEWRRKWEYRFCTSLIDIFYIAQIGFATVLTALGASGSSYTMITINAAINTAIAGVLAFLKGQGLPSRLWHDWVGLRNLRIYIEDRERILESGFLLKCPNKKEKKEVKEDKHTDGYEDLQMEVATVLKMYDDLMATIENSKPDFYVFSKSGKTGKTGKTENDSNH
jgi:hypothetical protein